MTANSKTVNPSHWCGTPVLRFAASRGNFAKDILAAVSLCGFVVAEMASRDLEDKIRRALAFDDSSDEDNDNHNDDRSYEEDDDDQVGKDEEGEDDEEEEDAEEDDEEEFLAESKPSVEDGFEITLKSGHQDEEYSEDEDHDTQDAYSARSIDQDGNEDADLSQGESNEDGNELAAPNISPQDPYRNDEAEDYDDYHNKHINNDEGSNEEEEDKDYQRKKNRDENNRRSYHGFHQQSIFSPEPLSAGESLIDEEQLPHNKPKVYLEPLKVSPMTDDDSDNQSYSSSMMDGASSYAYTREGNQQKLYESRSLYEKRAPSFETRKQFEKLTASPRASPQAPPVRPFSPKYAGIKAPWSPRSIQSSMAHSTAHSQGSNVNSSGGGSPAGSALRKAVAELRQVKMERDQLRQALQASNPQTIVEQTKTQMDREFRLVIRAMMDEKARALRAANSKTDFMREQLETERNRTGMALADIESLVFQRRPDVPRTSATIPRHQTVPVQIKSGLGPQMRFRRPRMEVKAPTHERFVFASSDDDEENEEDIISRGVAVVRAANSAPFVRNSRSSARKTRLPQPEVPRLGASRPSTSTPAVEMLDTKPQSGALPPPPPPQATLVSQTNSSKNSRRQLSVEQHRLRRPSAPAVLSLSNLTFSSSRSLVPTSPGSTSKEDLRDENNGSVSAALCDSAANKTGITSPRSGSARSATPGSPLSSDNNADGRQTIPKCQRPAEVIYASLLQAQPGKGTNVQVGRVRTFLKQSELLPPTIQPADLDVLLVKHSKRSSVMTLPQFQDLLADVALALMKCGIIAVDEQEKTQETNGELWEWGVREPRTKISRGVALRALGNVLFPNDVNDVTSEDNSLL